MAVFIDAVGPSSAGFANGAAGSSITYTHVCGAAATFLIVGVSVGASPDGAFSISSVTYNGVNMTAVAAAVHANNGTAGFAQMFYLINPTIGSNSVIVTILGGNADIESGSLSFWGVDTANPLRHIGSATGNSITPTINATTALGNILVDVVACGATISTSGQTLEWNKSKNGSTAAGNAGQSIASGSGSTTMSYRQINSDFWAMIVADIVAVNPGTNRVGVFSKDAVLAVGAFDVGIPIAYGLYDDDFVAQFSGTVYSPNASQQASVPWGVFSKDATLDGAFDD